MYTGLEHIDPARNCWRWYALSVQPTLFGDRAFNREWGRIGDIGGQTMTAFHDTEGEALDACLALRAVESRRGYVAKPKQLSLPL